MNDSCCEPATKKSTGGETKIPILIGIFTVLTLILGGWLIFKASPSNIGKSEKVQAYAAETTYDWGEIKINGGNVSREFTIENRGTEILKLTNVKTSCACTNAQITVDGKVSPYFGMHSTSSWVGEVEPGKSATLNVIFDPLFHGPEAVGPIERLVAVETNDTQNPTLEFDLTGNVVKK